MQNHSNNTSNSFTDTSDAAAPGAGHGRPLNINSGQPDQSSSRPLSELTEAEILGEFGWPPPIGAPRPHQNSEERPSDPMNNVLFPDNYFYNPSRQPMFDLAPTSGMIDLNASYDHGYGTRNLDINRNMESGLTGLTLRTPITLEESDDDEDDDDDLIMMPFRRLNGLQQSNGRNREDSRRLAGKRRAAEPEGFRQFYLGESSNSVNHNHDEQQENENTEIVHAPPANEAAQSDNFPRNIRLRRTENAESYNSINSNTNTRNSPVQTQASNQSTHVYCPFNRFPNLNPPEAAPPVNQQAPAAPIASQAQLLSSWIRGHLGTGPSSSSSHPIHPVLQEIYPRNNYPMLNSGFPGSLIPGMAATASQNLPTSGVAWFPHEQFREQYLNRLREVGNQSTVGINRSAHMEAAPAVREMENGGRGENVIRPPHMMMVPRPSGSMGRNTDPRLAGDVPDLLPALTATQRRSRLVSEVRNALALVRRGGMLRFEDVMVIDRTVLIDVHEEPDVHEDMRLDVDNMTYEELLALGERIGNVETGLSEEAILTNLRRQKHQSIAVGLTVENEPCCICQEEYVRGEDLGKLKCGHDFHYSCIKQWLLQKNICPICKMTGLEL